MVDSNVHMVVGNEDYTLGREGQSSRNYCWWPW